MHKQPLTRHPMHLFNEVTRLSDPTESRNTFSNGAEMIVEVTIGTGAVGVL